MNPVPAHRPNAMPRIVAAIDALLCTLLAALLGAAGRGAVRARPRDLACGVLIAAGQPLFEAELEPEVEWVMVPAPWRATQGAVRTCGRIAQSNAPSPARPGTPVRAPPACHTLPKPAITAIAPRERRVLARARCAAA